MRRSGRHPRVLREPELEARLPWFEDAERHGEVLKSSDRSVVVRVRQDGRSWILKHYRRRKRWLG